jgi:2-hydroxymuconate-semialdehyde hydrolase
MELMMRDIEVDGARARIYEVGSGFPILLMHGVGPGTCVPVNFGRVLEPLSRRYHVFGTDLIGFGGSGRKAGPPYFDYPLWLKQAEAVFAILPEGPKGILGHSLSSTLAMRLAGRHADVTKLLLSAAIGTPMTVNAELETLWTFPADLAALRRALDVLFYDSSFVSDAMLEDRLAVLNADGYAEYFKSMFAGDKDALLAPTVLAAEEFARILCDVAIVHGRLDAPCPLDETAALLADALPQADLYALSACGHGPASERPETFLSIVFDFFG